jgi:glycosyltransferase involved in cell wall biosynthesis
MKILSPTKQDQSNLAYDQHQPPLNVLHIIGTLQLGGAESQVATLAQALNNERYTVSVCCLHREGAQANVLRNKGINVVSFNMRLRYWPVTVYRLYRLIKQLNVQIVHTHLYDSGIWGRLVGKLAGAPVIMTTEHGMTLWKKSHHLILERFVNQFTDKIIAVSEDIRRRRIEHEGVPPEKIITIPNAVNIEQFSQASARNKIRKQLNLDSYAPVVGAVARLVPPKRLDYLLAAARLVCQAAPQARFIIIGDGPLRQELENQAAELKEVGCVQFLGSRQDIPDLLSALDIFVLSSEREGLPVAMLEAMAASVPVVVTGVGGIPEVIRDGQNGLLVPPHEPERLAQAILNLIGDPGLRRNLAEQGLKTVNAHFSANAVSRQIIALYDDLLKTKKRGYHYAG